MKNQLRKKTWTPRNRESNTGKKPQDFPASYEGSPKKTVV